MYNNPTGSNTTAPLPKPLGFGSIGDTAAKLAGIIDENWILNAASIDTFGMCLPRTGMEASMRPPGHRRDAAIETATREFSGLFLNTVAAGWLSYATLQMLGNSINFYNPKGVPGKAWISADSMQAFGTIYEDILKKPHIKTAQEARQLFVKTMLTSMASSDRRTGLIGVLKAAESLEPEARSRFLHSTFQNEPKAQQTLKAILESNPSNLIQFMDQLEPLYSGKLSANSLKQLEHYFELKECDEIDRIPGTNRFDQRAAQRTASLLLEDPLISKHISTSELDNIRALPINHRLERLIQVLPDKHAPSEKSSLLRWFKTGHRAPSTPRQYAQEQFNSVRLQLSMADLHTSQDFIRFADDIALKGGLTDNVQLIEDDLKPLIRDNKKALMMNKNRQALLKEMKYFLEQYVDRANYQSQHASNWKNATINYLYGASEKQPKGLSRWIPKGTDGLIQSTIKSKGLYTYFAVLATTAISIGVAFYNNWSSKKRNGGKVIFYGDGGATSTKPNATTTPHMSTAFSSMPSQRYTAPANHHVGVSA